ncbi:MAG TPA: Uma2 family endonuclease [Terriglobales bacterium]|nr:Uma2 family endonuclease [Terriglobales bacterium]
MERNAVANKTSATLADYMALDEPDGPRYELDEGELVVSPSTTLRHNRILNRLIVQFMAKIEFTNLGIVATETDFLLGPATVRCPDLAIILATHYKTTLEGRLPLPLAPDVAIEIVSPSDRVSALQRKVNQYLQAGTQSVWLIYPTSNTAHRWIAGASEPVIRTLNENWDEPQLLPGVTVPFRDVFPQE